MTAHTHACRYLAPSAIDASAQPHLQLATFDAHGAHPHFLKAACARRTCLPNCSPPST